MSILFRILWGMFFFCCASYKMLVRHTVMNIQRGKALLEEMLTISAGIEGTVQSAFLQKEFATSGDGQR